MTLIDRIQILSERAQRFGELEKRRVESRNLQELRDKVKPLNYDLGQEVQQMRLLQDEGINPDLDLTTAEATRARLDNLLQRFVEHRNAESLTRRNDWTRLEEGVHATCKDMGNALKMAWRQFVDTAYRGEDPDDLDGSLPQTDLNIEQLKTYRKAYQELRALGRTRPGQRADFDRVCDLARQLSDIGQRFERDVPEDVDRFLRAVNAGGAELDLVTPEVMDWIRKQNKTNRFHVIARKTSS